MVTDSRGAAAVIWPMRARDSPAQDADRLARRWGFVPHGHRVKALVVEATRPRPAPAPVIEAEPAKPRVAWVPIRPAIARR